MKNEILKILSENIITASAPCRIDSGGTIDIAVFYYPLSYLNPSTFNIAIDLRTFVKISAHTPGLVKISSAGFSPAEFHIDNLPFNHPMGLLFAIAAYFRIDGIHLEIKSTSPPKSALGGSSSAAVAVIAAFNHLLSLSGGNDIHFDKIPWLAHAIEESVAGVACGCQDQLAAAYGGANAWYWKGLGVENRYYRRNLLSAGDASWLNDRMIVCYCGVEHVSSDVNREWINGFISGKCRSQWVGIIENTNGFIDAFAAGETSSAVSFMNRETDIRREMTPHVLDDMGEKLVEAAREVNCGARFTGAGGGGCLWALGDPDSITALKSSWNSILNTRKDACVLNASVDMNGVVAAAGSLSQ